MGLFFGKVLVEKYHSALKKQLNRLNFVVWQIQICSLRQFKSFGKIFRQVKSGIILPGGTP